MDARTAVHARVPDPAISAAREPHHFSKKNQRSELARRAAREIPFFCADLTEGKNSKISGLKNFGKMSRRDSAWL